jgi:hypothetical protein
MNSIFLLQKTPHIPDVEKSFDLSLITSTPGKTSQGTQSDEQNMSAGSRLYIPHMFRSSDGSLDESMVGKGGPYKSSRTSINTRFVYHLSFCL